MDSQCVFCRSDGGRIVYRDQGCRVVVADEPFAGFCRVVWNTHVREMTDLSPSERSHFMEAVYATEAALRDLLAPAKMNLASLGNQVPHLHWHVIPRFTHDSHFPRPVWADALRAAESRPLRHDFEDALGTRLATALGGGLEP